MAKVLGRQREDGWDEQRTIAGHLRERRGATAQKEEPEKLKKH
jgi:hypothetical protein